MTLKLPPTGEDRWALAPHAYVVVYERDGPGEDDGVERAGTGGDGSPRRGLLTVYDCGAAQKPPSAQVLGTLTDVRADHDLERTPTGYVVRLREPATLVREDETHWAVVADERR